MDVSARTQDAQDVRLPTEENPRSRRLREETELATVVLGGADEVLANLAVRTDLLAEVGDHLCAFVGGSGRDRQRRAFLLNR